MQSPDAERAGRTHGHLLHASKDAAHGVSTLPVLMIELLEGDAYRQLVRPKDGKVFTLNTVSEWVLGEPWAGLDFKSWDMLYAILKRTEDGRRAMAMLVERGAPEDGFAEDVKQEKAKGKSIRQIAKEKGVSHVTVLKAGNLVTTRLPPIYLAADATKAAKSIITARGLAYARELAAAIAGWAE